MEKGLARFRVSLLCFCCGCFVAAGCGCFVALRWQTAAGGPSHFVGPFPFREPMPPAAVCHLSAAGTPTASWSTSLFGSQCRLRLSATSAPRALQPRPGPLPFSGANAACGCLPPQRRGYSNRVLVQCPVGLPMPPAAVCHLSAVGTPTASWHSVQSGCQCRLQLSATSAPRGTPTASWSSALSGCQCRLWLSATSAPPVLQPRPGPVPSRVANASCGCLPPQRRGHSNRVLVHFPFREPMPPAAVCHLSAAGTPTASWSSALSGCQCLLRLSATSALPELQPASWPSVQSGCQCLLWMSATSAPRALQPRPGTGTMPTSTPVASSRGEGDIYRPFGTGTLNRTTSGAGSRGKTVWIRCQTGLLPMLRPDFGTASPTRGLSVASWRGEGDIYRPFGTGTLNRATSGAGSRGKTVWNRCQTVLLPMLRPDFGTASPARGLSVASRRGEGDIYRPFGTGTLNRTTSGVESRGKTVWNRCQTGLLPMLRTDFGTAPPARGLSVASWRGEAVLYRLFVHKKPLFHGH